MRRRLRRVSSDTVRWAAQELGQAPHPEGERLAIAEMAAIEETLDLETPGTRAHHRHMLRVRGLLAALLALIVAVRTLATRRSRSTMSGNEALWPLLAVHLERAATALENGAPADVPLDALRAAVADAASPRPLQDALAELVSAVAAVTEDHRVFDEGAPGTPARTMLLHRDWIGVRAAALRTMAAVMAVGAAWLVTGWSFGPFMLMGTCIMATLFSTFDDPALILRKGLTGTAAGAAAAVACRLFILPGVGDATGVLLMMLPFMLAGGIALSNRVTTMPALDYNMCFLLLVQPGLPSRGASSEVLNSSAAVLLGTGAALLAFRTLLPVTPSRRLRALVTMTVEDLERLARLPSPADLLRWRARLNHRILRVMRRVESAGDRDLAPVHGALAALHVGRAIETAHALRSNGGLPAIARKRLHLGLARLGRLSKGPDAAAKTLHRAALDSSRRRAGRRLSSFSMQPRLFEAMRPSSLSAGTRMGPPWTLVHNSAGRWVLA